MHNGCCQIAPFVNIGLHFVVIGWRIGLKGGGGAVFGFQMATICKRGPFLVLGCSWKKERVLGGPVIGAVLCMATYSVGDGVDYGPDEE